MAIVASDVEIRLSIKTGSAGDTTSSAGATSLGKYVATTVRGSTDFDDVSSAENAANTVDYRCFFLLNKHATLTLKNAVVFISAETAGGTSVALAADNIAASAKGASSAQADQIANETTAPTGVGSFSSPTTAGAGVALGDIGPGQVKAFWVKRTAANTAAVNDGWTPGWSGETEA